MLWSVRLLLLGAVGGCAALALAVVWMGTVDLVHFAGDIASYTTDEQSSDVRSGLVADVVKIIDAYLLAAILVVAAFGLYELFVGRLDARRTDGDAPRLLVARSLDDLKDRIAKLVVLILVIELFQRALSVDIDEAADLLALGGAIALASVALVLPTLADAVKARPTPATPAPSLSPTHDHAT
ncbi:MAG TPA: YqhA family protein [Acidimicrobiia bacterium]|nr:YqhA family protein [Acidimicrobiia bacterium]